MTAAEAFRMVESILSHAAPIAALPPVMAATAGLAPEVLAGLEAAAGLVADIADKGLNPITHITRIRSSLSDFGAVTADLNAYADGKPTP